MNLFTLQKRMARSIIILILLLILGGIVAAFYLFLGTNNILSTFQHPTIQTASPTPTSQTGTWKTYMNVKYGYSLEYPSGYVIREDSDPGYRGDRVFIDHVGTFNSQHPPFAFVIDTDENRTAMEVNPKDKQVEQKVMDEPLLEYLYARVASWCNADGVRESTYCDKILRHEQFISASGISGYKFFLDEILVDYVHKTHTARSRGPIFAFDVYQVTNQKAKMLFLELVNYIAPSPQEIQDITAIAKTLKF